MQRLVESPALRALDVLVGEWTIEIPDPPADLPPAHGHVTFEWMKGGVVLLQRSTMDVPEFPDGVCSTASTRRPAGPSRTPGTRAASCGSST